MSNKKKEVKVKLQKGICIKVKLTKGMKRDFKRVYKYRTKNMHRVQTVFSKRNGTMYK